MYTTLKCSVYVLKKEYLYVYTCAQERNNSLPKHTYIMQHAINTPNQQYTVLHLTAHPEINTFLLNADWLTCGPHWGTEWWWSSPRTAEHRKNTFSDQKLQHEKHRQWLQWTLFSAFSTQLHFSFVSRNFTQTNNSTSKSGPYAVRQKCSPSHRLLTRHSSKSEKVLALNCTQST